MNTQPLTTNAQDGIFGQEAATSDPVIEYSLLGQTVEEGIFGWLAFGIDLSKTYSVGAAATLTENGGVANPNGGGGGPGGPGGPPGGPGQFIPAEFQVHANNDKGGPPPSNSSSIVSSSTAV